MWRTLTVAAALAVVLTTPAAALPHPNDPREMVMGCDNFGPKRPRTLQARCSDPKQQMRRASTKPSKPLSRTRRARK